MAPQIRPKGKTSLLKPYLTGCEELEGLKGATAHVSAPHDPIALKLLDNQTDKYKRLN